jgi:4-amino-4-deoxy-L-arabinose transferase-like glycosyltransferase
MTDSPALKPRRHGWAVRLAPWLLIGALLVFHGLNNWIWLADNVTWAGWDKPRHLAQSLRYDQLFDSLSLQSLFTVMTSDSIRPPLIPASATVLYRLFGRTADVATMTNMFYMAILLATTYALGRRWGGLRLGLLSAALLAFFPMFYAMSRHFYLEFALTAMVALAVYLLLATDGFRRRGVSVLFGVGLGLGMLAKRTFPVFVAGPLIVVVLTSGLLPALWQRVRQRPRLYWKRALLALAGGLALAALWYLPNRAAIQDLILGNALFFFWWALAALAIYFATLPSAPWSNALLAAFLGAGLASTWYLARIEFVRRVALYAYGIDDPRGRSLGLGQINTYLYYLRKLANEHLSVLLAGLLLIVLLVATLVYLRRQGSVRRALRRLKPEAWIVLAWIGVSYAWLTLSIYHETRAFTPVLPAVALLFGAALLKLPWRRIRWALLAVVFGFAFVQFLVLTYEPVYRLLPPRSISLPFWGNASLFAQGPYIQLPDEGQTDRGYWIVPDVLSRMDRQRQVWGRESLSLGLLANTAQINAGPFIYSILTDYPALRVESLADYPEADVLRQHLFAHEYVLVKRVNEDLSRAQEDLIQAILDGQFPLFAQAFELGTTYLLPDGDTVYLYRQRYPLPADYPVEYVTGLAESLGDRARAGDAILLTPPSLIGPFVANYAGPAEVYLAPEAEDELASIAARHRRAWLVLGDAAAGPVQDLAREWLNQHAFWAAHEWAESLQLLIYGTLPGALPQAPTVEVGAVLGGQIQLLGYDLPATSSHPGDIVPLTLFWQLQAPVSADYRTFVHLLDAQGQVVAQTDSGPVGDSRPTSGWREGEVVVDRHGVLLPAGLEPGEYTVQVGMYLPETEERLPVQSADGALLGDSLSLAGVQVTLP